MANLSTILGTQYGLLPGFSFSAPAAIGDVTANTGAFTTLTASGNVTFNANVTFGAADHLIFNSTSGISANGSFGNAGQVLTSNGTATYWAAASVNTAAQYTWSNTHTFSANVTVNAYIADINGDVRYLPISGNINIPIELNPVSAGIVLSTSANVTVNGAVLSTSQAFSVFNNSASNITIISGTGATMYLAGTATTGNRTLAQRGVATILMVGANTFVISGPGVT